MVALAASALGACSMMPAYERPVAPVPASLPQTQQSAGPVSAQAVDSAAWADYFADERLRGVIALALDNNRDLRIAALNIERARAQYGIQRADLLPSIAVSGGQSAQRVPGDLNMSGEPAISRQYSANLGFASYELDFFGRVRSLEEQALQVYLGTEEARRSAQVSLVAEVANAWLRLAADRERLALARSTLETRQQSVTLVRRSLELGAVSALDLNQAETLLQTARADAARYAALVAQDENALALLVGAAVPAGLQPPALDDSVAAVPVLPADLSSEVLVRRPDVAQAERALMAANASIGAARAAFFPRITLTASAGTASSTLDGLFDAGSGAWSFVPQIRIPIFEAGRLQASLDVAEIQRDINVAQYEKAIQSAFREVADALAERATLAEQLAARQALVQATQRSFELSEARYKGGVDSYLNLLDAQRSLYGAQLELIGTRLSDAVNRVALYKALGGGWR
ncbi:MULTISPECIES: AdeC/AdeK/OprM family multidrug efflux complex outer membrane factor [unclassified Thauera]|uniref:AdeC/AdeK/OprM family multidrug efflux complex outer membrane factor n=1 Tax=unclassified Thauera TaxID=2609274 RepID=UPI0022DE351B|nr:MULTISPECIES: AdeC/AdeK/OprM family multidrug efflux complex outer membrane factor [unclassified Thauera]WBL66194.1 AdeC/AdeK/OprM family multidrug efflux complex outer membrane factor [Thauera sp. WB-2]HNR61901.1 AdeC/AdeK/OprM family multidrug efflux complex outer membrane factor [Thauera sp.]HNS92008.1 AdeC/AdeK/OprM family multidrug efflux complex outer membrane factor [Thauera sp.]